jgi:putative copper resistance protein D
MSVEPQSWPGLILRTTLDPIPLVGLLAAAVAYLAGVRRQRAEWPMHRTSAFLSGLALVAAATGSGIGRSDTVRFSVHAVQHVLLGMAAPLLLVAGAPATLARRAGGPALRRRMAALPRHVIVRAIADPLVVGAAFTATLYALYLTPLYRITARQPIAHALLHAHFLAVGCLYASAVLGLDSLGRRRSPGLRLLVVAVGVPAHTLLGVVLLTQHSLLADAGWDPGAQLADQHQGAGVLLAAGELFGILAGAIVVCDWIRREERSAGVRERVARGLAS